MGRGGDKNIYGSGLKPGFPILALTWSSIALRPQVRISDTTSPACEIPKLLKRVVPLSISQLLDITFKPLRRKELYLKQSRANTIPELGYILELLDL